MKYSDLVSLIAALVAAVLAQPAAGLTVAGSKEQPQAAAALDASLCSLAEAPALFALDLDGSSGEEPAANNTTAEKRQELKLAIQEYKAIAAQFKAAEAKLQAAMEQLLEVPSVDGPALTALLEAKKNTLVAFYAPWCPHCQRFVLHDGKGNPQAAPLELFRKKLLEEKRDVGVVRFDLQKHGQTFPSAFTVKGIPAMYFVNKEGKAIAFRGNPHDAAQLEMFVKTQVNGGAHLA
eukprot:TRINITY_DN64318_c0_g1_i1.p1 TRINITY_DN64318_c0_g1~~TRINITY_DN64318_c0_g1_i1.p1  ORF type:complete len:235 (+),score=73.28 TRINITY_DN64318_c0_g1_i1:71-775(+)